MEPLFIVAGVTFAASFFLIVRSSRNKIKYQSLSSETASVKSWKTTGARTSYYRLAVVLSGLITMAVVAVMKYLLY